MRWEEVHRDVFNAEASAIQTEPQIQVHLRSKYEAFAGEVLRDAAESGWGWPQAHPRSGPSANIIEDLLSEGPLLGARTTKARGRSAWAMGSARKPHVMLESH